MILGVRGMVSLLTLIIIFNQSVANVDSDLGNFVDSLGYNSNVTQPQAYHSQAAGYFTGGSLFLRGKTRNMQFAQITAPALSTGCGGINLTMGGFSFVSKQQLVDFGKNIMSSAAPYFFNLALETYAPQVKSTLGQLQAWAQEFNENNLSTCEAAQDALASVWPKHTAAQRHLCEDIGRQNNVFSDWAAARQGCSGGTAEGSMGKSQTTSQGKKYITRNVNVVWKQLMTQSFLSSDTSLAEFFMSLSGTVVFDKAGNPRVYGTLLSNTDTLTALMNGGNATLYHCDTTQSTGCLNLTATTSTISPSDALVTHVQTLLLDLQTHVQQDEAPTQAELSFLQKTSMPVLKLTEVALETGQSVDTTDLATLIAQDILVQYLSQTLQNLHNILIQADKPDAMKLISQSMAQATTVVNTLQLNMTQRLVAVRTEINQAMATQKMVMGALSNRLKAATGL